MIRLEVDGFVDPSVNCKSVQVDLNPLMQVRVMLNPFNVFVPLKI